MADHAIPDADEKEELSNAALDKMRKLQDAIDALTEARAAVGTQFAEIGNSDKVQYSDRETGESKFRGISEETMAAADATITDALNRAKSLIESL